MVKKVLTAERYIHVFQNKDQNRTQISTLIYFLPDPATTEAIKLSIYFISFAKHEKK